MRPGDRFTILRIMMLVALLGVGMSLSRTMMVPPASFAGAYWYLDGIRPVLLPPTLAVVIARCFVPQARRRAFRPPGAAACLAVVAGIVATLPFRYGEMRNGLHNGGVWSTDFWGTTNGVIWHATNPTAACAAIVATWAVLAAQGRWRPEPSWSDRLGRILSVTWLAAGFGAAIHSAWQA